jgi:ABC-type cobalamin/Fe3+-siderophores transport system ATPase subunit
VNVTSFKRLLLTLLGHGFLHRDRPSAGPSPEPRLPPGLRGLLGDPEVMLLDQPLSSVDLTERLRLLRLRGPRRTLLLASRHPHIDEGICDYVAFLREGRVAVAAPISQLAESDLPLSVRGIELLAEVDPAGANGAGATDGR